MPAGYSGTPLTKKLGLKPGQRARFVGEPDHYRKLLGRLPDAVKVVAATRGTFDFIHLFVTRSSDLDRRIPGLIAHLASDGNYFRNNNRIMASEISTAPLAASEPEEISQ